MPVIQQFSKGDGICPVQSLNEGWFYAAGEQEKDIFECEFDPPSGGWQPISVPGNWDAKPRMHEIEETVWYCLNFLSSDFDREDIKSIFLRFHGISALCHIWLNENYCGQHLGIWTSFEIDVSLLLMPTGNINSLYIKVIKPGNTLPLSDVLAGFLPWLHMTFGGIWKPVELIHRGVITIKEMHIIPNINTSTLTVSLNILNTAATKQDIRLDCHVNDCTGQVWSEATKAMGLNPGEECKLDIILAGVAPQLWDIDDPNLYYCKVDALTQDHYSDTANRRFGWRDISIRGSQLLLNGNPIMVRGILHWGFYPNKVAPIPSPEEIRREIYQLKQAGFNMIKHCLYVPIKEFFDICDEMGMLVWQELPLWCPQVTDTLKREVRTQYKEICESLHSHPSIILWTLGCELNNEVDFLGEIYDIVKKITNGSPVRDNSGSGECYGGLLQEHADYYDYHFYTDPYFYRSLMDYFGADWREEKPWLYGEFCDMDTLRDFTAISADPLNEEIQWNFIGYTKQKELIEETGLLPRINDLIIPSQIKAIDYRKKVIEGIRQHHRLAGYVVSILRDTATLSSGFFDDFGKMKHLPEQWRQFNSDTVITLNWDNRREFIIYGGDRLIKWDHYNYWSGVIVRPHIVISHFGRNELKLDYIRWSLINNQVNKGISGEINKRCIVPPGNILDLGVIEFTAPEVSEATRMELNVEVGVSIAAYTRTDLDDAAEVYQTKQVILKNKWSLWFYPVKPKGTSTTDKLADSIDLVDSTDFDEVIAVFDPCRIFAGGLPYPCLTSDEIYSKPLARYKIIIATEWNQKLQDYIFAGGNLLYIQVHEGFFSTERLPFWREAIHIIETDSLPTCYEDDGYCGLQWYSLATDIAFTSKAFIEKFGENIKAYPILHRLDARRYLHHYYIATVHLGKGVLMATTLRFQGGLGDQADGFSQNVFGQYLLWHLVKILS